MQEAYDLGPTIGWDFKTETGITLNNDQIINAILSNSAYLAARLKNNVVITTYAKEYRGNDSDTITLYPKPVIDFDQPRIRRKNIVDIYNLPQWGKFAYFLNHAKGSLKFRFNETMIDHREPFYCDNLIYVSYISGNNVIPDDIKASVLEMVRFRTQNRMGLNSMKGGSGAYDFESWEDMLKRIANSLKPYKMRV